MSLYVYKSIFMCIYIYIYAQTSKESGSSRAILQQRCNNNASRACMSNFEDRCQMLITVITMKSLLRQIWLISLLRQICLISANAENCRNSEEPVTTDLANFTVTTDLANFAVTTDLANFCQC